MNESDRQQLESVFLTELMNANEKLNAGADNDDWSALAEAVSTVDGISGRINRAVDERGFTSQALATLLQYTQESCQDVLTQARAESRQLDQQESSLQDQRAEILTQSGQ